MAKRITAARDNGPALKLRTYQLPVFWFSGKLLIVEFARQTGKSFTLANWAVKRLLEKLKQGKPKAKAGRSYDWSIFVISNSRTNGIEFGNKVSDVISVVRDVDAVLREEWNATDAADPELKDCQPVETEDFFQRMEISIGDRRGRIVILAASPRTARGFSGDLILDEFAFHEHAERIWDAAEPIISSNPDFVVRIASTHNGPDSLFNRWLTQSKFPRFSIKRSEAWHIGRGSASHLADFRERWRNLDPKSCAAWERATGAKPQDHDRFVIASLVKYDADGRPLEVTPEEREDESRHERAIYRQNYENEPYHGDNLPLLPWDVILRASIAPEFEPDQQSWSADTLEKLDGLRKAGDLWAGQDYARVGDLSVVSILHENGGRFRHVARLEMRGIQSAQQRREMERLINKVGGSIRRIAIDFTGPGEGLCSELSDRYGSMILPVDFRVAVPIDTALTAAGDKRPKMQIPEKMALDLQRALEDVRIEIPHDPELHADIRKPCRVLRNGRVSIAAASDAAGHADRFWSLALALHGATDSTLGAWTDSDLAEVEIGRPEWDDAAAMFAPWG